MPKKAVKKVVKKAVTKKAAAKKTATKKAAKKAADAKEAGKRGRISKYGCPTKLLRVPAFLANEVVAFALKRVKAQNKKAA
jgi:hypothetical protein